MSHVLTAMGLSREQARCSLRLTLNEENTAEEVDYIARQLSAAVERLRARGVLTVSPAQDNRRQRLLGFAPDALPMVAVLADIQRCSMEPLFAGFTAQEQQTLQDYLRRMDANLLRELNKE